MTDLLHVTLMENRKHIRLQNKAWLQKRKAIESNYIYKLPGYGAVIAKNNVEEFKLSIASYLLQLEEYAKGVKQHIETQIANIVDQLVKLIQKRNSTVDGSTSIDLKKLHTEITYNINSIKDDLPKVDYVFKDITYQQTKDAEFFELIKSKVPPNVMEEVGGKNWAVEFRVVKVKGDDFFHKHFKSHYLKYRFFLDHSQNIRLRNKTNLSMKQENESTNNK